MKTKPDLSGFEEILDYKFTDINLLYTALSHTSYVNEFQSSSSIKLSSNQRLEFLGDTVLSTVVSTFIFKKHKDMPEGAMSKFRAALVCEGSLYEFALSIKLDLYILLGVGEEQCGGRNKPSILADAFESVIAAIYIDGGFSFAEKMILNVMQEEIDNKAENYFVTDYKSNLQEQLSKIKIGKEQYNPQYSIINTKGPEHALIFIAKVEAGDLKCSGEGRSKKEAEQSAAKVMLEQLAKRNKMSGNN